MLDIRRGLYIIIFSMPFYLVRFSVFGIPTTLLEAMIYILFVFWLLRESRSSKPLRELYVLFKNEKKLSYGIILLFAGLFISTAYSSDLRASLGILKGWFIDPFLIFLVIISRTKERKDMRNILSAWALSGFMVAAVATGYYIANKLTFDGRLHAFYLSPNHLAMYLAPALLIATWLLLETGKLGNKETKIACPSGRRGNWILDIMRQNSLFKKIFIIQYPVSNIIALMIIAIPLYLTHSYGALLGISAGLSYMFGKRIFVRGQLQKMKIYPIAVLALLFFGAAAGYSKIGQIENSNGRSSLHSRLMIWNASGEMIKESPLVGIGPGTFEEKYLSLSSKFKEPYLEWAVPQPHNIFLAFYLQTGLIGFVGFILILFWFFQQRRHYMLSRRHVDMSPSSTDKNNIPISNIQYSNIPISLPTGQAGNILIFLMIYFLVHGLIDTTYWKNDLALMFWLVLGLSAIRSKNADGDEAK